MSVIISNRTRIRRGILHAVLLAGIVAVGGLAVAFGNRIVGSPSPQQSKGAAKAARPGGMLNEYRFIENKGQWDSRARFGLRTSAIDTWVTDTGVVFDFFKLRDVTPTQDFKNAKQPRRYMRSGHVVEMSFDGMSGSAAVRGERALSAKQNYIVNGQPTRTATVFEEARMVGVYPGIDARLYVDSGKPRYDLIVNPGADPSAIRLRFNGADGVQSAGGTDLTLRTSIGNMAMGGLVAYQVHNGTRQTVPARFALHEDGSVGFDLGAYDPGRQLVIDPIVYSTLYGGVGGQDYGFSVAVDAAINSYVAGATDSASYPTSIGAYDEQVVFLEGFCTKFMNDGADVVYSTVIGGNGDDWANDVAIDVDGLAYVVGRTDSTDFPSATVGPGGGVDGFIVVLNPDGTGVFVDTKFGGTGDDEAFACAVDQTGDLYIVGNTLFSPDFPVVNAFQPTVKGDGDAFLAKCDFGADGSFFEFCTYLGGTDVIHPLIRDEDQGIDVAVDDVQSPYVLISTQWNDAPKLAGSYDLQVNGNDSLILKFAADGQSLQFGTFLGGNDGDFPAAMALDSTNNVYVTGTTFSFNYPRTFGVFDRVYNNGRDSFLTKMNRTGNGLVYSTFCGFTSGAAPASLAVDDLNQAHIGGTVIQTTQTPQVLPVTPNADDPTFNGPFSALPPGLDAFLQVFNDSATGQVYCSYLGGSSFDQCIGIALDGARNAYMVGYTQSCIVETIPWPTTPGAFKESFPLDTLAPPALPEGFLTKVKTRIPLTIQSLVIAPNSVAGGDTAVGTVTLSAAASTGGATVTLTNDNNSVVTTPSSFTIPQGQTTGTFQISTVTSLTTTQVVKITAEVEGDFKSANLTVSPWLTALTLSNDTVVGGNPVGGRITIFRAAPQGGVSVNMASTVPAIASVPAIVTVPTGLVTVTFDVTTVGVANPQTVDISASYLGLTRTVTLAVIPARLASLSFVPTVVSGGTDISGAVTLDGKAPTGGVVINLAASDPAVTVPATVTIAAQTQATSFPAQTLFVANNTSVTITATFGSDTRFAIVDVLRANLISLAITPDVVQGGNLTTGTVGLDHPAATGGVTIPISSNNPAVASAPSTVLIPSGSTNANFTITTAQVASQTIVTFTATRGPATLTANLTVNPIQFTVDVQPSVVVGGQSAVGTVTLVEPAPVGGTTINLSSNNAALSVPVSVFIAESETEGTFSVSTVPVTSTQVVTVTATKGTVTATTQVTVNAAGVLNLTINPSAVSGGSNATGTVQLTGAAPAGGVVVTLSSSDPAASPPATVTVAQGATTASFTITTVPVPSDVTATITATANGGSDSATLTITAANLIEIKFVPSRVRGGQNTVMTVTLDAGAPVGGAAVAITYSNSSLLVSPPTTVVVPAGATSRSVTVLTRRVSRNLSTQVSATYGGTAVFTVLTVTR